MKTIIIFYEHVSREYDACINLKNEIEKISDITVYIYSFQFQVIDAMILANKCRIDAIIIPYGYKESSILPIATLIRKAPIPFIINLHHEQVGAEFNEHRFLPIDECTKNHIIHFVWTNEFRNKLIKIGVNEKLIYIIGNIRTDLMLRNMNKGNKQSFGKEFGIDPNKKWILFCESGTQCFTLKEIDMRVKRGYKREDLLLRNLEIKKALNATSAQLAELDDAFFDKFEFIYRAHPGILLNNKMDDRIKIIDEYSIYDWLNVIDLNISRLSTALFESEMYQVPTLRYDPTDYPKRLLTFGLDRFRKFKSLSQIDDYLIEEAKLDLTEQKVFENYLGIADGCCTKRAAVVIAGLISNEDDNYCKNPIHINCLKFTSKKIASNVLARFIVKYRLNKFRKISGSLTLFKNDIPPSWNC